MRRAGTTDAHAASGDVGSPRPSAPPHIVLVGLPGAGKSTAGRLLAERLGCRFVDFDVEIARRAGKSVASIFAEHGEPAFRDLESELTSELIAGPPMVMAPGGGWMAHPGNVERLEGRARTVYLQVAVPSALARLRGNTTLRPLLSGADPAEALARLKGERERFYIRADAVIDTEPVGVQEVTQSLVALATRWGWPVG